MNQSPPTSLLDRALTAVADAVCARPGRFVLPQLLLAGACVVYTVFALGFSTSRNDLVGSNKPYHNTFLKFLKEFPLQDDLVAIVESDQVERNRQFVARLGARLEAEPHLFRSVFYRRDLRTLGTNTLLITPTEDLRELSAKLEGYRPFIATFTQATNLHSFFDQINTRFLDAAAQPREEAEKLVSSLPALQKIIRQATNCISMTGVPPPPGMGAFIGSPEAEQQMHISYADGQLFLVVAHPASGAVKTRAVARLRELAAQIGLEVPGVNFGITGEPVLEHDEMAQAQIDTTRATVLSFVLVALIFILGYHETGRPLKATLALLVGIAYTLAWATAAVGRLNLLTITFAPILIGLAIDFGVHLVTRYEEELRAGADDTLALHRAMVNTGRGIFTGCLTTAVAFLAMGLTDFDGIRQMGIISGGGLILSLVPMMTLLPALLLRGRQNVLDREVAAHRTDLRERLEGYWLRRPRRVMALALAITAAAWLGARHVGFDYDLRNLQSAGLPAVKWEKDLMARATNSVLFGAVVARDAAEARALTAKLQELNATVADVVSMAPFLGEQPAEKVRWIRDIKAQLADLHFAPADMREVDPAALIRSLGALKGFIHRALEETQKGGRANLAPQLQSLWEDLIVLIQMIERREADATVQLAHFQRAMMYDVRETFAVLQHQSTHPVVSVASIPQSLQDRFIAPDTGRLLLRIQPRGDIWQRPVQEAFVREVRAICPEVTGTPVQLFEYTELLRASYVTAALYALAAVVLMVWLHFRSLACVALSLLPVAVGTVWMAGVMGVTGTSFNPANIMTLPLVVGIGVTNGVHILNRFAEEQHPAILGRSTGKAIIVSGLTTVAGFGSLVIAQHQGIASLGLVMAVGTATCMAAALVFLPALLTLMMGAGWRLVRAV